MIEPKLVHSNVWPNERYHHTIEKCNQVSFISTLSAILVNLPHYTKLTREEIMNLMDVYLHDYDRKVHLQLFDCFLENQLIIQESNSVTFSIHPNQNSKSASGIFTPLTKCYSSSCQTNSLSCYSPLCPNNIKKLKPLKCVNNSEYNYIKKGQNLINQVKKTCTKTEMKRQAAIAELLTTEYNYCQDLAILDEIYAIPLLESEQVIKNRSHRQRFYHTVFGNYLEITQLHNAFYNKTAVYWQSGSFSGSIGKYILDHVTCLVKPYLVYTAHHAKSVHCLALEQRYNARLIHFLNTQDKRQCTRRLGIYHYLTSPTLWIGKLKLLVEAILKNTAAAATTATVMASEEDLHALRSSVIVLHNTLLQMNELPVTTEKELRQEELLACIYVYSNKSMEFELLDIPDNSRLIEEDTVKLIRASHPLQYTAGHIFLFSHALIVAQPCIRSERTEYVVLTGFPIPVQMIFMDPILSTSFMRRLSLAKTSIVSNSYQLISSIRNPDSSNDDDGSTEINTPTTLLEETPVTPERSTSSMIKQIKTKLLKLRTIKHQQPSLSAPVSPVSSDFPPSRPFSRPIRRGSEPLLFKNTRQQQKFHSNEHKTIKVGHRSQPEFLFQLLFDSRIKKEGWKVILTDTIQHNVQKNVVEIQQLLGRSLIELSIPACFSSSKPTLTSSSSISSNSNTTCSSFVAEFPSSNLINDELGITCASSFTLATKNGLLIGPDSECSLFIPLPSIRQISAIDNMNKLIILIGDRLVEYSIDGLMMNNTENSHQKGSLISSDVSCFTIGKIKNQATIFYITLDQMLILNTPERKEYKLITKDPVSIKWMDPLLIIQSLSNHDDIECINLTDKRNTPFKVSTGPLIDCALLDRHHGILSNSHFGWFYSNGQPDKKGKTIEYESHVNHIAICHPYLFCFSTFVIEVRSLETTDLLQIIQGYHIHYLTHNASHLYFTMSSQLFKIQISDKNE